MAKKETAKRSFKINWDKVDINTRFCNWLDNKVGEKSANIIILTTAFVVFGFLLIAPILESDWTAFLGTAVWVLIITVICIAGREGYL